MYCPSPLPINYKHKSYQNTSYKQPFTHMPYKYQYHDKNLNYWCESCDRGFSTENFLQDHQKQHQKCNIDGCQFVAHPKLITKHIQMQHSSGLYNKIAKLQDPEEIKKWREERKKKYPTKSNIEKKNAEIKEKIKRGEKMGLGFRNTDKRQDSGLKRKHNNIKEKYHKQKRFKAASLKKQAPIKQETSKDIFSDDLQRVLKPFSGIQNLILSDNDTDDDKAEHNDLNIEDEDWLENNCQSSEITNGQKVCGALSTLLCNYGSTDDEDSNVENESLQIVKQSNVTQNKILNYAKGSIGVKHSKEVILTVANGQKDKDVSDDSGPEEVKIVKNINDNMVNENAEIEIHRNRKEKREILKKPITKTPHVNKVPSTLLQKLLNKEIRQERNIVLQCIRYIVKNNYFDDIK